jgi:hypothetical protein
VCRLAGQVGVGHEGTVRPILTLNQAGRITRHG